MIAEAEADDRQLALTTGEYELLSRIHNICVWMALEDRDKVIKRIMSEFNVTEQVANLWIGKAEDFMALGVIDGVDRARSMYHLRLLRMHDVCMKNAVRDQVEVTTKQVADGKGSFVPKQSTKVKPRAFDAGAMSLAFKAAKEAAYIMGARPASPRLPSVGTMNVQVNHNGPQIAHAQVVQDLNDQALAGMIGADIVLLPESNGHPIVDVDAGSGSQGDAPDDPSPGEGGSERDTSAAAKSD